MLQHRTDLSLGESTFQSAHAHTQKQRAQKQHHDDPPEVFDTENIVVRIKVELRSHRHWERWAIPVYRLPVAHRAHLVPPLQSSAPLLLLLLLGMMMHHHNCGQPSCSQSESIGQEHLCNLKMDAVDGVRMAIICGGRIMSLKFVLSK
jgi:hypothetical protein